MTTKKLIFKSLGIFIFTYALTGCDNPVRQKVMAWPKIDSSTEQHSMDKDAGKSAKETPSKVKAEQIFQEGTEHFIGEPPKDIPNQTSKTGTHLNFNGVDLRAFVQTVLGDVLKQNYLIDPNVSGTVTIQTINPLPKEQLMDVLQEVLELNGATLLLRDSGYRVVPIDKAMQSPLIPRIKKVKQQGYSMQIIPLRYISVTEMEQILRPSLKNDNILYTDKKRNLLILKGTEEELQRIVEMISVFDVDWLEGKTVSLYPLEHVEAKEIIDELSSALEGENGSVFNGLVRLIPIERVNSILVVSHTKQYLNTTRKWIKRLDISDNKAGKRLYVYHLKNAKAVDIAKTLTSIFGSSATQTSHQQNSLINPLDKPTTISQSAGFLGASDTTTTQTKIQAVESVSFSENNSIKIIADEKNNTVVVLSTPYEYGSVESAIKQLDILPKQVLIEVTILEVSLTGDLSYGVEWFFKNGGIDGNKTGQGQLSLGGDGISPITPGFSYSIVDQLGDVRAVLNALESESDVRILSSPSILVLDNSSAEISVGDEIPVPTRQSTSNNDSTAPTVNEIEYRDTGILLSVSPRINSGGLVTLEVSQEVSDAVTTQTSGIDAPTISQRRINTSVAIQNGESVLLGGLIRERQDDNRSGLPGISRVPLIGNLFGQSSNSDRKSELLMILTPKVISNAAEAKALTDEYRDKLAPEFSSMSSSSSFIRNHDK